MPKPDDVTPGPSPAPPAAASGRRYAAKPAAGPIRRAVENAGKDDQARRRARHAAIVAHASAELEGATWAVTDPTFGEVKFLAFDWRVHPETGAVVVNVLATLAGGELVPGLDNPYLFDGPIPIERPDGTFRKELRPGKAGAGAQADEGEVVEVDVANVVEAPADAMRENITTVILNHARRVTGAL